MGKETKHEFDASFLTALEPLIAMEIAAICKRAGVREGVRAHYPNGKPNLAGARARRETRRSSKLPSLVQTKGLEAISLSLFVA